MWEIYFVGLLAPHPRQHGMLHPKLRLTAQEKSNEKKIFCSAFSQKICASFMPEGQNLELNALRLRGGMGATQAPIYNDPLRMCVSLARSAQWEWPCHCRGVGAASAPTSKNLYAIF